MLRFFLVVTLLFVSGCSVNPVKEMYKQRELLFAPESLNPLETRQLFVDDYAAALSAARVNPTPGEITAYVDVGNALNARNCGEWLRRTMLASKGLVLSDHNMNVFSALLTTIAGIANWSSSAVAALGAAQVAAAGFSNNLQQSVGAPSQYIVQSTLMGLLGSCSNDLTAAAPNLTFSQAYMGLETCSRVCTAEAASEATTNAVVNMQFEVQRGGTLRAIPRGVRP